MDGLRDWRNGLVARYLVFSFLEHFVFCLLLAGWTPTLKPQSWILQIWKSGICGQDCLRNSENRWENLEFIQLPRDEILGFLVDSQAEALELRAEFAWWSFGHACFLEHKGCASVEGGLTRLCDLWLYLLRQLHQ